MSALQLSEFARSPNVIAEDYRHAGVASRIHLVGHTHQAIPDVGERGYTEHWDVLNKYGEERWDEVFSRAWRVREGFASMIEASPENIALAASLHELFVRFLSALPLKERPKIISTDAEHPSVARQLERLAEDSIELKLVAAVPAETLVERLAAELDDKTAGLCLSSVNFVSGHLALELDTLMPQCLKFGVELFVDAYLSVNVQHFSLHDYNLEQAFVAGGGAKYCQVGNGNCFMHVPPGRDFRPEITGWFGCFDPLFDSPAATPIAYADDATRFNGSSHDALPYFRACHVMDYFQRRGLTVDLLHDINDHQKVVLAREFQRCDMNDRLIRLSTELEYFGGFISFKSPYSRQLCEKMRDRGVHTDYRKHWLRIGPAPYLCDEQLTDGILALQESVKELEGEMYT